MNYVADSCGQLSANFVYGAIPVYVEGYQSWMSRCQELNGELTSNEGTHMYCDSIGGTENDLRENWWISSGSGLAMAAAAEKWVRRQGGEIRNPVLVVPLDNHIYYASFHLGVVEMDAAVTPEIFAERSESWKESGRNVVAFDTGGRCVEHIRDEFELRTDWLTDVGEFESSSTLLLKHGYFRFRDASLLGVALILTTLYLGISTLADNRSDFDWQAEERVVAPDHPFFASGVADIEGIVERLSSDNLVRMRKHDATDFVWKSAGRTFTVDGPADIISDAGNPEVLARDWPNARISVTPKKWVATWQVEESSEDIEHFEALGQRKVDIWEVQRRVMNVAQTLNTDVIENSEVAKGSWRETLYEFDLRQFSGAHIVQLGRLLSGIPYQIRTLDCKLTNGIFKSCSLQIVVRGIE